LYWKDQFYLKIFAPANKQQDYFYFHDL